MLLTMRCTEKKQELYFFRDNPKYIKQINKSVSMLLTKLE